MEAENINEYDKEWLKNYKDWTKKFEEYRRKWEE